MQCTFWCFELLCFESLFNFSSKRFHRWIAWRTIPFKAFTFFFNISSIEKSALHSRNPLLASALMFAFVSNWTRASGNLGHLHHFFSFANIDVALKKSSCRWNPLKAFSCRFDDMGRCWGGGNRGMNTLCDQLISFCVQQLANPQSLSRFITIAKEAVIN